MFSRLVKEHKEAVHEVLKQLRTAGLVYSPTKSKFFRSTIDFLGHKVLESGFTPIAQNTAKLSSFVTPTDLTTLMRFLGLLNFYRQFLPGLASLVKPLTNMTLLKVPFSWTLECQAAFSLAKSALEKATSLAFPIDSAPIRLATDTSNIGIGAIL